MRYRCSIKIKFVSIKIRKYAGVLYANKVKHIHHKLTNTRITYNLRKKVIQTTIEIHSETFDVMGNFRMIACEVICLKYFKILSL